MCFSESSEFIVNIREFQYLMVSAQRSDTKMNDKKKKKKIFECFILAQLAQYDQKHEDCRLQTHTQYNSTYNRQHTHIFLIFSFWMPEKSKGRKSIESTEK